MHTDQQRRESILAKIIVFLCVCYMLVLLCLFFFGCNWYMLVRVWVCDNCSFLCMRMVTAYLLCLHGNRLFLCVQGNCFFLCLSVSTAFLCVDVLQGMDGNCFLFCVWMQRLVRGLKHVTRIQCSWTFIFIKYSMWKPSPRPHWSPCTSYCMTFTRANMSTLPVIYEDYVSQLGLVIREKFRRLNVKKKAVSFTTTLHMHLTFLYISLPSLHDYDMKVLNFTSCGGKNTRQRLPFFPELW